MARGRRPWARRQRPYGRCTDPGATGGEHRPSLDLRAWPGYSREVLGQVISGLRIIQAGVLDISCRLVDWTTSNTSVAWPKEQQQRVTSYIPAEDRYRSMTYRRCGRSGLLLPA